MLLQPRKSFKHVKLGLAVASLCVLALIFLPTNYSDVSALPEPQLETLFSSQNEESLVYFYLPSCSYCQFISPLVVELANQNVNNSSDALKVYAIDLSNDSTESLWYDWEAHEQKYQKVIGTVMAGVEILNEGENRGNYPTNEGWIIETIDNEVVAIQTQPQLNESPTQLSELKIAGTPTVVHFKEGKVVTYADNSDKAKTLLNSFLNSTNSQ